MKKIKLTKGFFALVDDDDYKKINKIKWHVYNNIYTSYARNTLHGHMHRLILNTKKPFFVDHIDGNGLNNQKENLRECNLSQNNWNSRLRKDSTTGYKGVSWHKGMKKFQSKIKHFRKWYHLGYFDKETEAAEAYKQKAKILFKEFARF